MEKRKKSRISRRYLAGLLDGEGYISIQVSNDTRWNKKCQRFSPVIKVALTDKSAYLLFEIKEIFGGHIYCREYEKPQYNDSYCWEIHNYKNCQKVLDYVFPYLILKKEQARIVLELIKTKMVELRDEQGQIKGLNPNIISKRQSLYNLVKSLNRRGRLPAETKREPPTNEGEAIVRTFRELREINRNIGSIDDTVLCHKN